MVDSSAMGEGDESPARQAAEGAEREPTADLAAPLVDCDDDNPRETTE
jgi:hypothetical protein